MPNHKAIIGLLTALVCASLFGCTLKKQETPSLTGPSELGTSITVSASPDVLPQNGTAQSVITIVARDANGQPVRNMSLHVEITVNGVIQDFGTLSARNVVTDQNGRTTLVYTAPPGAAIAVDNGTIVSIQVTPTGTDFGNATPRVVSIRLVPQGGVAPPDGLTPDFTITPPTAIDHQVVQFDASLSTSNPNNPIVAYSWDFGDGDRASGRVVQHSFDDPGPYIVTLTIADDFGRTAQTTKPITISPGAAPVADFVTSPSAPDAGQAVFFNATTSRPAPGHSIVSYQWDFGDGATGSGSTVSHVYANNGGYTVILTVQDEAGRIGTKTATVTIGNDAPTAAFTFSPASPATGTPVNFDGRTSTAVAGRTIVSYSWTFGDGGSGTGATTSHSFLAPGTYNVTLTVVDSQGKSSSTTKPVNVL